VTTVYLSHSDISTFKSCRQKWDFSSVNRQSLRHKKTPALYLTEGSGFHEAIEAGVYGRDPYEATKKYLLAERQKVMEVFKEETGHYPWPSEMTEFDESMELTMGIVRQYFTHYGLEDSLRDQGLTYIAAEIPFKIPLDLPDVDPGSVLDIYYVGTFDGLAIDDNENLWIVENKTYQAKPDVEDLQYHSQCNGYAVAFEMLTGMRLTGTLYNGVAKQLIKKPKVLSNGLVSTDMRQLVTVQSYLDGLNELNQDPFDPRYTPILMHLQERERQGDSRFFHREKIFFTEAQVSSWYDDMVVVAGEMISDPAIYRTVPYNGCGPRGQGCWFRDLCHTKHDGGDVQSLLDARYMTGSYGTMESMQMETHVVSSVPELKEFLRSLKENE
jgi:hypothetical protein